MARDETCAVDSQGWIGIALAIGENDIVPTPGDQKILRRMEERKLASTTNKETDTGSLTSMADARERSAKEAAMLYFHARKGCRIGIVRFYLACLLAALAAHCYRAYCDWKSVSTSVVQGEILQSIALNAAGDRP